VVIFLAYLNVCIAREYPVISGRHNYEPLDHPSKTSDESCPFAMATTPPDQDYSDHSDFDDRESLASIETDDGQDHPPEKILAEITSHLNGGIIWYLVQWKDCPVIRSSWESADTFDSCKWILEDWEKEKEKQEKGESTPLDIAAFNKKVLEVELAARQRRLLRRLKRSVNRVLSIVSA
jgi:hypothetical protein